MEKTQLTELANRILQLTESNRELQRALVRHEQVNLSLETERKKSDRLLGESRQLQNHLQDMNRQILKAQEAGRKTMSLRLQDDIVQALEGIHLRLLVLSNEVSANNAVSQNEIALTKESVQRSAKVIKSFFQESSHKDEN